MRHLFLSLLIGAVTFAFIITDAQAKRFGGGKSFGHSRSFSQSGNASNASRVPPTTKPATAGNKWLAPLAGLAAGGLLASLFMSNGLGSGILSWLMIAGVVLLLWRLISRLRLGHRPLEQQATLQQFQPGAAATNVPFTSNLYDNSSHSTKPIAYSDFDEAAFLRQAKSTFIRLQAAYDNKNFSDIREFTLPQVFAEIQMQCHERGEELNQTEVISIHAELLDLTQSSPPTASVLFSGLIREQPNAVPETVNEIWHFDQNADNQNWLVSGIQQQG